jgi:predicted site-specific integrase-resolvase
MAAVADREASMHPGDYTLLTPEETARRIRRAVQTLARWRCEGAGPAFIRVGGRIAYRAADVERWLESRRVHSTSERPAAS